MPLHGEAAGRPTYRNLLPVGSGNSQVFTGQHDIFGRPIVQKVVPENAIVPDAVLRNEPQLLESLKHARIPKISEAQYDPTRPGYIVMVLEHVGTTGGGEIVLGQQPPLSVGECVAVGLDLLGALNYLHSSVRLVHRDVKPDNIRLGADRRTAWLIDFNLAGLLDASGLARGVATPFPWMAPEIPTSGYYSIRSEVYALGVMLYELLRGRQMLADYPMEKVEQRVTSGRRGFPQTHYNRWPPHVPDRLRRLINKAVAEAPESRWSSAAEMRDALGRLVYVDWRRDDTDQDRWIGRWPSTQAEHDRIDLVVEVRTLARGPHRGHRRATARYTPGATSRRLAGVDDRVVEDDSALAHFFDDVERRIASLRPAS